MGNFSNYWDLYTLFTKIKNKIKSVSDSIPTVNDGTLTIKRNGTDVATFTANQSGTSTADITVPTALSSLTDDATHRTVTDTEKSTWNNKSNFSGSYTDLTNKPTIPTKTSELTNNSNFVADSSYVHTDNNYTTAEKTKLSGIASGAEVNVQSDWNQTTTTADDYIKNKPTIPTSLSDLTADSTHRLVTDTEKTTWNGKANVTTVTIPVFTPSPGGWRRICKIKSTSGSTAGGVIYVGGNWSNGQPVSASVAVNIMHSSASLTLLSSTNGSDSIIRFMRLIPVSSAVYWLDVFFNTYSYGTGPHRLTFTGDVAVSDIQNPISITTDSTTATDEVSIYQNVHGMVLTDKSAGVAKTLDINSTSFDIASKLSVGESAAVIVSDSSLCTAFSGETNSLSGVVSRLASNVYAWDLVTFNYKFVYVRTDASFTVARSFYVTDTPTFTEASTRANIASGETMPTILGKIKKFFTDLKTVAFSGSYNDLSNKPTIPAAANNGTLTIQKNGANVQTFTANQSTNVTANITVPTALSGLTDDSTHRLVTDTEKSTWNNKQNRDDLMTINDIFCTPHEADYNGGGGSDMCGASLWIISSYSSKITSLSALLSALGGNYNTSASYTYIGWQVPSHDSAKWNPKILKMDSGKIWLEMMESINMDSINDGRDLYEYLVCYSDSMIQYVEDTVRSTNVSGFYMHHVGIWLNDYNQYVHEGGTRTKPAGTNPNQYPSYIIGRRIKR